MSSEKAIQKVLSESKVRAFYVDLDDVIMELTVDWSTVLQEQVWD